MTCSSASRSHTRTAACSAQAQPAHRAPALPLSSSLPDRFLAKHAAIFFPRDVTMNYKRASGEYVKMHEAALSGAGGGGGGGSARGKQFSIADPKKLLDLD